MKILTVNSGSTSIKFKLFNIPAEEAISYGKIESIGSEDSNLSFFSNSYSESKKAYRVSDHRTGLNLIIEKLIDSGMELTGSKGCLDAIGHRVVNIGSKALGPQLISKKVINCIRDCLELAPLHNPPNLVGIEVCMDIFSGIPNIAVYDNTFHKDMPAKAYLYGIPYKYYEKYKIRKYGFHGIAYACMADKVSKILNKDLKSLKIIALMLGGGSSITAIKDGRSIDTSMGFTPAEGLIMSTRCGDIDPAIIPYLMEKEDLSSKDISSMINQESGLFGLSNRFKDFQDIEKGLNSGDQNCIRAFSSYAYRIKKYIGAYIAAMNGVDAIVFGGGIGENSSTLREEVLKNLDYLGIRLDKTKNRELSGEGLISSTSSDVFIMAATLDEELIIARETYKLVKDLN